MAEKTLPSLESSPSPFLRHGASQPVRWMPWGEEAFERARREDLPILLDIGAVWCHWCHVMDRESYEDPATAELINRLFVPVKVDRDERPDVDARYQRAVQALTGQGGWPLTAFLTPDGEAYYAGTYFPPHDAHGRPGFPRVLTEVARVWREGREKALEAAGALRERLSAMEEQTARGGSISPGLTANGLEAFARDFDFRHGGFGSEPKFPNAGALGLLLDAYLTGGAEWQMRIVRETLEGMARGGIHDQLGGGFHRYSVDARWLVPHFEKMAYDNGPLLEVYARARAVLGPDPLLDAVVDGVLRYYAETTPELLEAGGFPASQDADLGPGDDGAYWTWTQEEIREAVGGDDLLLRLAVLRYGLDDSGGALHSDPGRHVLFLARAPAELAAALELSESTVRRQLEEARRSLAEARARRQRPYVDQTLYTGWVALVASGHIAAARHLGRADAGAAAVRALERILEEAYRPGEGVLHRVGDEQGEPLLEDQAYLAQALLDAFELTQEERFLERAAELARICLDRFRDPDSGAFADRPLDASSGVAPLDRPHLPIMDAPTPAPNAVLALALLRLFGLRREPELRQAAVEALDAFAATAERMPTGMATYLRAVDWATGEATTVVVVGAVGDRGADALFEAALRGYRPRTVLRRLSPDALDTATLPEELAAMVGGESPRAYLCVGTSCLPPASDPEELRELLRG